MAAGHGARQGDVLGQVLAAIDARQHQVRSRSVDQLLHGHRHAVGRRALDGEAARIDAAHADRVRQGQGPAGPRLLVLRRADPDVVRQGAGDALQALQALGVDAVVVGEEDAHLDLPSSLAGEGVSEADG
jgi:hypothetical protein